MSDKHGGEAESGFVSEGSGQGYEQSSYTVTPVEATTSSSDEYRPMSATASVLRADSEPTAKGGVQESEVKSKYNTAPHKLEAYEPPSASTATASTSTADATPPPRTASSQQQQPLEAAADDIGACGGPSEEDIQKNNEEGSTASSDGGKLEEDLSKPLHELDVTGNIEITEHSVKLSYSAKGKPESVDKQTERFVGLVEKATSERRRSSSSISKDKKKQKDKETQPKPVNNITFNPITLDNPKNVNNN